MKKEIYSLLLGLVGGFALNAGAAFNPYGACAHVTRGEPAGRTCAMLEVAGIGWVRSDFDWAAIERKPGEWDFSAMDRTVEGCVRHGVQLLPILGYRVPWADPANAHLDQWSEYVRRVVRRYGTRLPVLEVWNEENIKHFWKEPNPTNYLALLKRTYEVVKEESPSIRVSFGGTAGVPFGYIEEVYKLGGSKYFDILSVHPYSHPYAPEGNLDQSIEKLRAIMAKYGDAKKPIWITEVGWPTHQVKLDDDAPLLRAALAACDPAKTAWRTLYLPAQENDPMTSEQLQKMLPAGSTVEFCRAKTLSARLARGDVDAVIYPFSEAYPADTVSDVLAFVKRGGVLVDFGGMPLWNPFKQDDEGFLVPAPKHQAWADRKSFRIAETAWWIDKRYPEALDVRSVVPQLSAKTRRGERFFTAAHLKPGDRFIPILAGQAKEVTAVCAGVYKFNSDYRGAVAVSGLFNRMRGTSDEARQAKMMTRSLALAFAEGVEAFFWYETTQVDRDPYDPESYFGMLHANFAPKPAYGAYMTFVERRPVGSVQLEKPWKSADGKTYFPQWKEPNGRVGGLIWTTSKRRGMRSLHFTGREMEFMDHLGARVRAEREGEAWLIEVGDAPIYFRGGELIFTGDGK